ncbi:hypothetical protein [Pseudomonas typographi]|uniref:Uncharacterized protein n=1 Tax=Pseudomonas typographi TaxID=2715964 RepID=A0ABR7Z772_9PSED|nr:hypothetical protein [Pseudomonas typographi]MBD1601163.1 hypothetical protein [Pseudomonas typographi]
MARARNIKPGLFTNELLVELPAFDRLLFIGLWCLADRDGRLEDRPKRIKLALFPYDTYDVSEGLGRLAAAGFIDRYEAEGFTVVEIVNFLKHQKPHGSEKDGCLPDKDGYLNVNDRKKGVVIPGTQRKIHVKCGRNNVKSTSDNVDPTLDNGPITVDPPLDNALILRFSDSPNPDSPNKDQEQKALVASAEATDGDDDDDSGENDPSEQASAGKPDPYTAEFESFWQEYPKRNTNSPKKAAWRVWKARVREGIDPSDLITAARNYHTEQRALGKVGSSYVKHPATFLGPDEWWREYLRPAGQASTPDQSDPTVVDGVKYPRQVPKGYQCTDQEFWGFDVFANYVYHRATHDHDYTPKKRGGSDANSV